MDSRVSDCARVSMVLLLGCSGSRIDVDAGGDTSSSLCGNGEIDRPGDEGYWEECDDGVANGGPTTLCSRQCAAAKVELGAVRSAPLTVISKRNVEILLPGESYPGVAFTDLGSTGIKVIRQLKDEYFNGTVPPTVSLRVAENPIALGSVRVRDLNGRLPIWIEPDAAVTSKFHMFMADVSPSNVVSTYEIAYPFSDGARPQLIGSRSRYSTLILDQSAIAPYDLLVALILIRSPNDIHVEKIRIPAPGRLRGITVETTEPDLVLMGAPVVQRVVQFFDDTATFVVIENAEPAGDPWAVMGTYNVQEFARGTWPLRPIGATTWIDGFCAQSARVVAEYTHPTPIALVTESGEVFVWQFSNGLSGETLLAPIGRVSAGTHVLGVSPEGLAVYGLWALEPGGILTFLKDSDCLDLQSPALLPQRFQVAPAWSVSERIDDGGWKSSMSIDATLFARE